MNTWKYVKANIDAKNIRQFEEVIGFSLPLPVAEFILAHNNGRPRLNAVDMPSGEERIFEKLLSFNEDDVENVFSTYENLRADLKPELIAIALDPFGNYFCIDTKNDCQVEFWMQESGAVEHTGKKLLALMDALH